MANNCGCDETIPCGCSQPCPPAPCVDGCITDTKSDCVTLSKDINFCGTVIEKNTSITDALETIGDGICDGIVVTSQDILVKIDEDDTTAGYLFDKITTCPSLDKTVTNIGGNETLQLCVEISATADNTLVQLGDGLYVPEPTPSAYALSEVFSSTVDLTLTVVPGGQSLKADAKISATSGNILIDSGGLYVPTPTPQVLPAVTGLDTNSIDTTVTPSGANYIVSSSIIIDPASTAPISITADGLKVDCCAPAAAANTPITINNVSPCITLSTSGLDNHTITPVVNVSPTANGLYVAAASAGPATAIIDSSSLDFTLVGANTYQGIVKYSANSCNIAQAGSDGAIFVPGIPLPYALEITDDGTDYQFKFSGDSTTETDYEVEFRGTTGSPLVWTNGDTGFDSEAGGILTYTMINKVTLQTSCEILGARVRRICGTNESDWVSIMLNPAKDLSFVSSNSSVSISQDCGEIDITVTNTPSIWTSITPLLTNATNVSGYYKIDPTGQNVYFRGVIQVTVNIPHTTTSAINQTVIDLTSITGSLDASINLGLPDNFGIAFMAVSSTGLTADDAQLTFTRTNNLISIAGSYENQSGGTITGIQIPISNIINLH